MGTALIARGFDPASLVELPLRAPEAILEVHRSFSMSDALTAATFGLSWAPNRDVADAAIQLAREVAGDRPVIASLAPGAHAAEAASSLRQADILLFETFTRVADLETVLHAVAHPRVWATVSFHKGKSADGYTPGETAARLVTTQVEAFGANCGDGLRETAANAIAMVGAGRPVIAQPNAGVGTTASPEAFAATAASLRDAGVAIIGGCCGVTAAHLALVAP
ncbi:MAG: homocysteine S-methyltransferase family protein [Myxococcota bacterium]